jgi:hypothetical protein
MKVLLNRCDSYVRRRLTTAAAALLVVFVSGCASPGQPRPPTLDLPEIVKDLTVERIGDEVWLKWTTSNETTDHSTVKGEMTAEICRITAPPSSVCAPVKRFPVRPGPEKIADTLPQAFTIDPVVLLAYRVQIFNAHGRSAGLSPEVFAAAGAGPPAVAQLRATPTRDGAMVEWQQTASAAAVELDRLPIGSDGVVVEPARAGKAAKTSSKPPIRKQSEKPAKAAAGSTPKPFDMAPAAPIEVKLRTPVLPTDAGGTVDHTAQMGESYRYTAQRVRSVSPGGHALELRSPVSPPVTVVMKNTFPPHAPEGLEAVPGGATAADRSIDLSWTPNTDRDLEGYIVYRQEIDSKGVVAATATRLNVTPVAGPAYRDQTAVAGRRYAYHVTAVDTAGNESAPSADVQEILREQ